MRISDSVSDVSSAGPLASAMAFALPTAADAVSASETFRLPSGVGRTSSVASITTFSPVSTLGELGPGIPLASVLADRAPRPYGDAKSRSC